MIDSRKKINFFRNNLAAYQLSFLQQKIVSHKAHRGTKNNPFSLRLRGPQ